MKRRNHSDDVYQRIASMRSLVASRSTRTYQPGKHNHLKKVFNRTKIDAPRLISFFSNTAYSDFFNFIKTLKRTAPKSKIIIDFSAVAEVKVAAMLILYSTIEQIQSKYGQNHVKTIDCPTAYISGVFQRFGFWALTKESRTRKKYYDRAALDICSASFKSKQAGDNSQLRRAIQYVQEAIRDSGMDGEEGVKAFAAITESFSNVWQHAYDDDFYKTPLPDEEKCWWIAVERINSQLFIAVYDSGVGIPTTLSKKPWYGELIADLLTRLGMSGANDGLAIRAAVEYGNSRFKTGGRGKGLAEAKDFVSANPDGTMVIYSGSGSYEFKAANPEILESLPSSMAGTLIQWNLKLGSSS